MVEWNSKILLKSAFKLIQGFLIYNSQKVQLWWLCLLSEPQAVIIGNMSPVLRFLFMWAHSIPFLVILPSPLWEYVLSAFSLLLDCLYYLPKKFGPCKSNKKGLHSTMFLSFLRNSPEDPGFWTEGIVLFSMTKLWTLSSFSTSPSRDIYTCSICHFIVINISLAQISEVFVHSDQKQKKELIISLVIILSVNQVLHTFYWLSNTNN